MLQQQNKSNPDQCPCGHLLTLVLCLQALCIGAIRSFFPGALWKFLDTSEITSGTRTALLFCLHTSFVVVPKWQWGLETVLELDVSEDGRKPSQWQSWRTSNRAQTESLLSRFGAISAWFKQLLSFPLPSHGAWKAESRAGIILTLWLQRNKMKEFSFKYKDLNFKFSSRLFHLQELFTRE